MKIIGRASNTVMAKLPGLLGKAYRARVPVPVGENAIIEDGQTRIFVERGRPTTIITTDKRIIENIGIKNKSADIIVLMEDRVMLYRGEFEGLLGVYQYLNGKFVQSG